MEKIILNLTQHGSTAEQNAQGVIDLPPEFKEKLSELLTFQELPDCKEVKSRASGIRDLVIEFTKSPLSPIKEEVEGMLDENGIVDESEFRKLGLGFMIGGAPFLMGPLADELRNLGKVMFAFSKREVVEVANPDGSVTKKSIFKHAGFVPACLE